MIIADVLKAYHIKTLMLIILVTGLGSETAPCKRRLPFLKRWPRSVRMSARRPRPCYSLRMRLFEIAENASQKLSLIEESRQRDAYLVVLDQFVGAPQVAVHAEGDERCRSNS
jgi:hypothetical protein